MGVFLYIAQPKHLTDLEHLLFAAYLIFFAWLVTKTRFFTASELTTPQLVIIFLLKVMAGILYGWIGVYYGELAQMVDTWGYHYEAKSEVALLKTNPSLFFSNIFSSTYTDGYGNFLASENSWWNDLKGTFFLKIIAIFHLLTFSNYYVNVILYSFLSLFGPIALYRVMRDAFPSRRLSILLTAFLIPSVLYWTSGIHKDGFIFAGLCLVIYNIYFGLKQARFTVGRIVVILLGLLVILALRNFLIIPLLPGLLAWVVSHRVRQAKPALVFAGLYLLFIVLFFTARYIHPGLDFPQEVAERQQAFLGLGGGSAVPVNKLTPNPGSFLMNAPQAFSLSTIRPYPSDVKHLLSLAAALEIGVLILMAVAFFIYRKRNGALTPFLLFCIFFAFSVLMMIGYTVNILGAIVRYRSIVLSLLVIPMAAQTDWQRVAKLLSGIMKNK